MTLDDDPYVNHHPHSRPFWHATATGVFLLPRCQACGRAHWYPRPFCPHCHGEVAWDAASGFGTVYAFSALRRVTPQNVVAYVQLDEGPMMLSNLVGRSLDELRIGDRVRAVFRQAKEGRTVPVFEPALR